MSVGYLNIAVRENPVIRINNMGEDKPNETPTEKKEKDYTFQYNWATVVKAFWDKYPHKQMEFVQYNKLIGLEVLDNGTLLFRRVQHIRKWKFIWAYILEEIKIDSVNKVMTMESKVLKKSDMVPFFGNEFITYKAVNDLKDRMERTLYSKQLILEGTINKALGAFSDGFTKGIKIVEENCETLKSMTTDDWVKRFSLR